MDWPKTIAGWVSFVIMVNAFLFGGGLAAFYRWVSKPVRSEVKSVKKGLEDRMDRMWEKHTEDVQDIIHPERGLCAIQKKDLARDITAVGAKVDVNERKITENNTKIRAVEDAQRDSRLDREHLHREMGEVHRDVGVLTKDVDTMKDQFNEMKVDIIGHISRAKDETLREVEKTREDVANLRTEIRVIGALQKLERGDQQ